VAPWQSKQFEGCWNAIENYKAQPIRSEETFIEKVLGLELGSEMDGPPKGLTDDELRVFEELGLGPKHPDELTARTGLPSAAVTSALLTLSLGDVVVEGPAGMYTRRKRS
jgi:predicted Rossmann fold nucleotide-binding protein DprA/Smf involved in DNA uptake